MSRINRREALKEAGGYAAGAMAVAAGRDQYWEYFGKAEPAEFAQTTVRRGLPPVKITDVRVIRAQPGNTQLINVKVLTDEPGLYGVGDGNHAERPSIVEANINQFLKPMVVGRNADEIEDIWQTARTATYWRAGVDWNNAMAAIDQALWDIMGKRAGMPVYNLLGGRVRAGTRMFTGADEDSLDILEDSIRAGMEAGYQHFRFGGVTDPDSPVNAMNDAARAAAAAEFDRGSPATAIRAFSKTTDAHYNHRRIRSFELIRDRIGWDIELGSDIHNNVTPTGALLLAKALEPYRPWFVEDLFTVDDWGWYRRLREETAIGVAMGETFTHQLEWLPLIEEHLIDFNRAHISAIGGLNMARKAAALGEFFNVRNAWHGPGNVSPIGHCMNMHLDLACYNFGIGEGGNFNPTLRELYTGLPEIRGGVRYPANDLPGFGVDINEDVAAKFPPRSPGGNRGARNIDGAPARP